MGANIGYWQVRYEDDGRTMVGYKSTPDPMSDQTQRSVLFRRSCRRGAVRLAVMHMGAIEGRPARLRVNPRRSATAGSTAPASPRRARCRVSSGRSGIR